MMFFIFYLLLVVNAQDNSTDAGGDGQSESDDSGSPESAQPTPTEKPDTTSSATTTVKTTEKPATEKPSDPGAPVDNGAGDRNPNGAPITPDPSVVPVVPVVPEDNRSPTRTAEEPGGNQQTNEQESTPEPSTDPMSPGIIGGIVGAALVAVCIVSVFLYGSCRTKQREDEPEPVKKPKSAKQRPPSNPHPPPQPHPQPHPSANPNRSGGSNASPGAGRPPAVVITTYMPSSSAVSLRQKQNRPARGRRGQ